MLAFGMERVGMESSRARRTRSVCVVALQSVLAFIGFNANVKEVCAPEWVSYDEECDVDFVGIFEDVVAGGLDHLAVGYDNFAAIKGFLLP